MIGLILATICISFPIIYFVSVIDIIVVADVVTTKCLVTTSDNGCIYTPIYPNFTGISLSGDCPQKNQSGTGYSSVKCYIHNENLIELNKFMAQMYQSDMQNNLLLSTAILILLLFSLIVTGIVAICFWTRKRNGAYTRADTESYLDTEPDQPSYDNVIDPELLEEIPLEREEV